MKYLCICLILTFVLSGCANVDDYSCLDKVFILAGSNRGQLEQVLEHYADDPLKLEAAKFILINMPGHYSYSDTVSANRFYDSLDSLLVVTKERTNEEIQKEIIRLYDSHNVDKISLIEDARVITADFLIDNIDQAFEQWQNLPWCKNLDFDEFCEYLLPYKVTETQELKPWRKRFAALSEDSISRMSSCSLFRISAFQATEVVNNCIKHHFSRDPIDYEIPTLYYRPMTRLSVPFGTCEELCQTGLNAFRAAGIPVAIDYVPVWGYGNRGHTWGIVKAPNGKDIPFVPIYMSPYVQHKVNETIGKVYRRTFAKNPELVELNDGRRFVPKTFANVFQRDVTSKYTSTRNLSIDVDLKDGEYVYLCSSSRALWKPVAFAKVEGKKALFKDVGLGCIYMVVKYKLTGEQVYVSEPVMVGRDGSIKIMVPNLNDKICVNLYRKAPLLEYAWNMAVKMENGLFEASNDANFYSSVVVGEVDTPADRAGKIYVADSIGAYRYWRYAQRGDSAQCYLGEIMFYHESENINKYGRPIGNYDKLLSGTLFDGKRAFDGDVLSAVSFVKSNIAWVGLDFGKPQKIDTIYYYPRSDGNMIEPNDEYELLYWYKGQWNSLGRKVAASISVCYNNLPKGALYLLLNNTKGNSVRIFIINEDEQQEWW
ncbi:MAG: discoidin domain-containing protein [Muribaculaceae bacterium]|nr:discoidin domain-containing protein [Muribaculaceae bacterium]